MSVDSSLSGKFVLNKEALNKALDEIGHSIDIQQVYLDTLIRDKVPVFEYDPFISHDLSMNKVNYEDSDEPNTPSL